jgi:hypothetical protein
MTLLSQIMRYQPWIIAAAAAHMAAGALLKVFDQKERS